MAYFIYFGFFYLSYKLLLKFIFFFIYIETASLIIYLCCCLSHLYNTVWIYTHEVLSEFSSIVMVSLYMLQTQFWQRLELTIHICTPTFNLNYEKITVVLIIAWSSLSPLLLFFFIYPTTCYWNLFPFFILYIYIYWNGGFESLFLLLFISSV